MHGNQNVLLKRKTTIQEENNLLSESFLESLKQVKRIKKVLILRSGRIWMVKQILSFLRERYPDAEISLIAQPSVAKDFLADKNVNKILWMRHSERIGILNIGFKNLKSLRREKYDLLVIPLSGKSLCYSQLQYNHRNIHNIIIAAKPSNIVFLDSEGTTIVKEFSSWGYFLSYFFCIKTIWVIFIRVFMFAFMLIILSAIISCDLWNLLKSKFWGSFSE